MGALRTERASGATGYLQEVAGIVSLGKGEREEEGGEEPRLASEESQGQGAGHLFMAG